MLIYVKKCFSSDGQTDVQLKTIVRNLTKLFSKLQITISLNSAYIGVSHWRNSTLIAAIIPRLSATQVADGRVGERSASAWAWTSASCGRPTDRAGSSEFGGGPRCPHSRCGSCCRRGDEFTAANAWCHRSLLVYLFTKANKKQLVNLLFFHFFVIFNLSFSVWEKKDASTELASLFLSTDLFFLLW